MIFMLPIILLPKKAVEIKQFQRPIKSQNQPNNIIKYYAIILFCKDSYL